MVAQVAPQQGGNRNRNEDQSAAHSRRAGLYQMCLRPVTAHRLADLVRGQFAYHRRSDQKRDEQCRHRGKYGAQCDVIEHAKEPDILGQPLGERE
jgi:hypothetical protein